MKEIINELRMQGLTLGQKAIAWYFVISLCLLCCVAEASNWAIVAVGLNFCLAAALLVLKVQVPEPDNDPKIV